VEKSLDTGEKALNDWVHRMSIIFHVLSEPLRKKASDKIVSLNFKEAAYLTALKDYTDMIREQDSVDNSTTGQLSITPIDEPEDNPERGIFFWKDLITVPQTSRRSEEDSKKFKTEVARLAQVLIKARPDLTYIPEASSWFENSDPGLPSH